MQLIVTVGTFAAPQCDGASAELSYVSCSIGKSARCLLLPAADLGPAGFKALLRAGNVIQFM